MSPKLRRVQAKVRPHRTDSPRAEREREGEEERREKRERDIKCGEEKEGKRLVGVQ